MLYFLGGFIAGIIITLIIAKLKTSTATFRIDHSDPYKPICRLDLNGLDLDDKIRLVLNIDHNWVCEERVNNEG